jgi:predicted Fe-Mo cluster-binding NifX family protein
MSESIRIAVPIESGEGLDAVRSMHFGHAAGFVLIDIKDGEPVAQGTIINPPHESGGCMTTVNLLASAGAQAVSAGGMGRGPMNGLMQAGIAIHHDVESQTVAEAVFAYIEGRTMPFGTDRACQGHH